MRLLLDTHFLIDLANRQEGSDRFWRAAREAAESCASASSLWEIAIKFRLGKLTIGTPLQLLPDVLAAYNLRIIAIDHRHAIEGLDVDTPTRDPFDRLLLAQCQVENLRLLTRDRVLAAHPLAWQAGDDR